MQKTAKLSSGMLAMKIEDFGVMQARYQAMSLAGRAAAVLSDASPALAVMEHILGVLSVQPKARHAVAALRKDHMVIGRMRASEAKTNLMDETVDFIRITSQKLAAWCKTLHTIADGKAKASLLGEGVPEHMAIAMAGISSVSSYLVIVKLIVPQLAKLDPSRTQEYESMLVEIRRCATVLSDCETASGLNTVVLH